MSVTLVPPCEGGRTKARRFCNTINNFRSSIIHPHESCKFVTDIASHLACSLYIPFEMEDITINSIIFYLYNALPIPETKFLTMIPSPLHLNTNEPHAPRFLHNSYTRILPAMHAQTWQSDQPYGIDCSFKEFAEPWPTKRTHGILPSQHPTESCFWLQAGTTSDKHPRGILRMLL